MADQEQVASMEKMLNKKTGMLQKFNYFIQLGKAVGSNMSYCTSNGFKSNQDDAQ